jgi:hypothetical protein
LIQKECTLSDLTQDKPHPFTQFLQQVFTLPIKKTVRSRLSPEECLAFLSKPFPEQRYMFQQVRYKIESEQLERDFFLVDVSYVVGLEGYEQRLTNIVLQIKPHGQGSLIEYEAFVYNQSILGALFGGCLIGFLQFAVYPFSLLDLLIKGYISGMTLFLLGAALFFLIIPVFVTPQLRRIRR